MATTLVAASVALTACGGGGSDAGNGSTTGATTYDPAAFVGTWAVVSPAACTAGFLYNSAYSSKASTVTITSGTMAISQILYSDASCTIKVGKLVETFAVVMSQGVVPGWSNEARMTATVTSTDTSADGGSGVTFNRLPDGTASMRGNAGKFLWAVNGSALYAGDYTSAKDSAGYPQAILSAIAYIK